MEKKDNPTAIGFDKEYYDWIAELSNRYRQSQIIAAVRVNDEMLKFYWSVGKDIAERQFENIYGSHFYENLSRDLSSALNKKTGFGPTSLWYTKNKGVFPNDTALIKLVYLAYRNAHKKWTMPVPNWGIISQQLAIKFEDRYNLL